MDTADNLFGVIEEHKDLLKYDSITPEEMSQYVINYGVCAFFHEEKDKAGNLLFCSAFFTCNQKGNKKHNKQVPYYKSVCDIKKKQITLHRCLHKGLSTRGRKDMEKSNIASKMIKSGSSPIYIDLRTIYFILKDRGLPAKDIVCLHLAEYVAFLEVPEFRHLFPVLIYTNASLFEIATEPQIPSFKEAIALCGELATVLENLE